MNKVICSQCKKSWKTNKGYLNHTCEKTGYTPKDPQHFGRDFLEQSKAALSRGNSLDKEKESEINTMIKDLDDKKI